MVEYYDIRLHLLIAAHFFAETPFLRTILRYNIWGNCVTLVVLFLSSHRLRCNMWRNCVTLVVLFLSSHRLRGNQVTIPMVSNRMYDLQKVDQYHELQPMNVIRWRFNDLSYMMVKHNEFIDLLSTLTLH